MANQNHLEILFPGWKEGKNYTKSVPDDWNQWRRDNRQEIPDFSGLNFSGRTIDHVNFSQAILTDSVFTEMTLEGINFNEADLRRTNFSKVTFKVITHGVYECR
jgi:hypothetical protein